MCLACSWVHTSAAEWGKCKRTAAQHGTRALCVRHGTEACQLEIRILAFSTPYIYALLPRFS